MPCGFSSHDAPQCENSFGWPFAESLQVYTSHERCPTQELCEAQGWCTDEWDSYRRTCEDAEGVQWDYGETHYSWTESTAKDSNNNTYVEWVNHECPWENQKRYPGVCVAPLFAAINDGRCAEDWQWHPLGCRVPGIATKKGCLVGAADGETWYWKTPSNTMEECMEIKGCKEPGRWGLSPKSEEQCDLCNGSQEPFFEWYGGQWRTSSVKDMQWKTGKRMEPVNRWEQVAANWKLQEELARPMLRSFANNKKTELLLQNNIFSESLGRIVCDCADEESDFCWAGVDSGALVAKIDVFCGKNQALNVGSQTMQLKTNCSAEVEGRRFLEEGSSAVSTVQMTAIGATSAKFEPCDSLNEYDGLLVTNTNGVIYGQVIGDGLGVSDGLDFEDFEFCMRARDDIRVLDTEFTTYDVAKRTVVGEGENAVATFTPLGLTASDFLVQTTSKMCITVSESGDYFPILLAGSATDDTVCASPCESAGGMCMFGEATGAVCKCYCGFSGDTCNSGCANSCSGGGSCTSFDTCECDAARSGNDCSRVTCPVNDAGVTCSRHGECGTDGLCVCYSQYEGDACEKLVVTTTASIRLGVWVDLAAT